METWILKLQEPTKGITALQIDVKTLNLTTEILEKALEQVKRCQSNKL